MPLGTFSLHDISASLGAAGVGRRGIGLGSRPRDLAFGRDPWPTRRSCKVKNNETVSRGTPFHSTEPCMQRQNPLSQPYARSKNLKSVTCEYDRSNGFNSAFCKLLDTSGTLAGRVYSIINYIMVFLN